MSGTHAGHGVIPDAHTYAAEVRRHLVGLTPEQVDDLTDGLEADLGEALVDSPGTDDLVGRFGQPSAYAAELRAAAGLPDGAAAPVRRRGFWRWVTLPVRAAYEACVEGLDVLRSQPWWPPVGELLTVLLPVAWVLRGWLAYQLVFALTGGYTMGARLSWAPFSNPALFVAMLAAILVSVQWGRGLWLPAGRLRGLPRVTTVVAVVAALPIMATLASHEVEYRYSTVVEYVDEAARVTDGVVVGGMAVSNLYVYDAEGNPLDGVQIYDDRGRPVETIQADGYERYEGWSLYGVDERWQFTSVEDEDGRARWNVYPLLGAPMSDFDEWDSEGRPSPSPGATMRTPPRPFAKAPAVPGRLQAPEAAATPGPADQAAPVSPAPADPSAEPEAPGVEGAAAAP